MHILTIMLLLFAGHAICDYPLQGEFLSFGKNRNNSVPGVPWYQCLLAHSLIHGGMVCVITHNVWFGIAEVVIHAMVDFYKCEGKISFNVDQGIHYICKILWAVL